MAFLKKVIRENINRLNFLRGLRISISFWLDRKKEEVMTKERLIARNDGVFLRKYQPPKIKSKIFVRFKFWKQIRNQNKIINKCSSNFKNQTFVLFMLVAIVDAIVIDYLCLFYMRINLCTLLISCTHVRHSLNVVTHLVGQLKCVTAYFCR